MRRRRLAASRPAIRNESLDAGTSAIISFGNNSARVKVRWSRERTVVAARANP